MTGTRSAPGQSTRLDPDELAALEDQRAFLLASLADLDRERAAGDLDDTDYRTLRDDYTARAAEVLRAIDEQREAFDAARRPPRVGRLVATGVAVLAVAVLAGYWVAHASGTRKAGQTVTGNAAPAASGGASSTTVAPASAATRCIPQITTSALNALKCFDAVLAKTPEDALALTYRGWTLVLTSQATPDPTQKAELARGAEANLTKAIAIAPTLPDPHAFRAILYTNSGRCDQARAELAKLDALQLPADSTIMQLVNSRLRPQLANGACPTS